MGFNVFVPVAPNIHHHVSVAASLRIFHHPKNIWSAMTYSNRWVTSVKSMDMQSILQYTMSANKGHNYNKSKLATKQ